MRKIAENQPENPTTEPESVPNPYVYPTRAADVAKLLDLSLSGWRSIRTGLALQKGASFETCLQVYIRSLRQQAMRHGSPKSDSSDLGKEKLRQAKETADKLELDNQRKRAELLPTDEVSQLWNAVLSNFRSRILELPNKVTPLLQAAQSFAEAEAVLKSAVTEALQELANFDIEKFSKTGYEKN